MTVQQRLSGESYPLKLSAQEFLALADAGLFERQGRTELIEGEIWTLNSVWRWHARSHTNFMFAIKAALDAAGMNLTIYTACSVLMSEDSVPEPDISIGEDEPMARGPIGIGALRIAVELSDTTRAMDLGRKAMLYARCGVPEYWVADRDNSALVIHWQPTSDGYAKKEQVPFGTMAVARTLHGVEVDTSCLIDH